MIQSDLVVLGGGPGGYTAAFHAADLGMEVCLVEIEPRLGGTCLLRGCIPSKALLHATEQIVHAADAAQWGLEFDSPRIDVGTLRSRTQKVVSTLTGGLAKLAEQRGVRLIRARGVFVDEDELQLEDGDPQTYSESSRLKFRRLILATGSQPIVPGFLQIGSDRIITSDGALSLPDVPDSMLVVGGGYIGLEMGTVYARLGAKVTVVEMLPRILAGADPDLARPLERRLKSLFAAVHTDAKVAAVEDTDDGVAVTMQGTHEGTETFDRVLVAVGRRPRTSGFGLDHTGVTINGQGFVEVDEHRRAGETIWAIGDVVGQPMLAHKASAEARVAVEHIRGEPSVFAPRAIPAVVFTDPEVAWVGLTEQEAKDGNVSYEVSKFPWAASGRAVALDSPNGLTKLLVDPESERVLGAGICGQGAGELIAEAALAIEMGATAEDLGLTIHAHPTMAETVRFAAEAYYGVATEIYRPKPDAN